MSFTDTDYEKERKRIDGYLRQWVHDLGLGFWNVKANFTRDEIGSLSEEDKGRGFTCFAVCDAKWQYQQAHLTFNLRETADLPDDECESAVVHELMHAMVCEMRESGINHEERVITQLTKAFLWVRDAAKRSAPAKPAKQRRK